MKLSNKTEYGLRALIYLGEHQDEGAVSLAKISCDEDISLFFLEKIFSDLKAKGIVSSVRGKNGGYALSKPLDEITLRDVVATLEEDMEPLGDLVSQSQQSRMHCKSHVVLSVVHNKIIDSLSGVKLADLCNKSS